METTNYLPSQGRSHAFESEGAQSPKAILGPFSLKKWEGPSLFLLLYGQKSGGGQAPRAPYIDYGPEPRRPRKERSVIVFSFFLHQKCGAQFSSLFLE